MSRSVPQGPSVVTPSMVPMTALVAVFLGQAIKIDSATGKATTQDNHSASPEPCIGVAANNAIAGGIVYVQTSGMMTVPTDATCTPGHFVGSEASAQDAAMNDLGDPATFEVSATVPLAVAGVAIAQTGNQLTMVVLPAFFAQAPGTASSPVNFVDAETPSTFTTNGEYHLANSPNPPASLIVSINDEVSQKPGNDRILIQGVDYNLVSGSHIVYTSTILTNVIRCWYRH